MSDLPTFRPSEHTDGFPIPELMRLPHVSSGGNFVAATVQVCDQKPRTHRANERLSWLLALLVGLRSPLASFLDVRSGSAPRRAY